MDGGLTAEASQIQAELQFVRSAWHGMTFGRSMDSVQASKVQMVGNQTRLAGALKTLYCPSSALFTFLQLLGNLPQSPQYISTKIQCVGGEQWIQVSSKSDFSCEAR